MGTLSNVWSHTNLWGVGEAARKEENKILPLSLSLISELLRAVPPHIRTETHTRICSFYKVNSALRQNKNTHRIYSAIWEIFALASSADNIFAILRWEPTAGRLSGSGIFLIFNQSWPLAASSRSAERHLLLSLCECVCKRERESLETQIICSHEDSEEWKFGLALHCLSAWATLLSLSLAPRRMLGKGRRSRWS